MYTSFRRVASSEAEVALDIQELFMLETVILSRKQSDKKSAKRAEAFSTQPSLLRESSVVGPTVFSKFLKKAKRRLVPDCFIYLQSHIF